MSPSTFVKKLVSFSDKTLRLSLRSLSCAIICGDDDMFVARTLSPKSHTAILDSPSSLDRGMTFSDRNMRGSNPFASDAALARSGTRPLSQGWKRSQARKRTSSVKALLILDEVNVLIALLMDEIAASIGAARSRISARTAKRRTKE